MKAVAMPIEEEIVAASTGPGISLSDDEERVIRLFPGATLADWEDWRWQIRNRIRTLEQISKLMPLTPNEEKGVKGAGDKLTMSIPPYFAALIDANDIGCPIRLQSVPQAYEFETAPEEMLDPCGEDKSSAVHGLVHRYPDRVLFLVNEMCAMYCRYCTRSRMVGDGNHTLNTTTYDAALDYIRKHEEIRDVLISGGDPLTLGDRMLEYIISSVKAIKHVEFVRIGTRIPVTLPQRVTPALLAMLKKHAPIWMSVHFNHAKEITPRVKHACNMIADAGIPMGSQTVLLRGVNDSPEVMKKLFHELLRIRVRPYYIYQCDPIVGSRHFRTSVATGINIMEHLRGHTTGYAVPTYVIDGPGGGGKIPVSPNYMVSSGNGRHVVRNFKGEEYAYVDPTY